jgi:hypothetical protein
MSGLERERERERERAKKKKPSNWIVGPPAFLRPLSDAGRVRIEGRN